MDANQINQFALILWMPVFLLWAITGNAGKKAAYSRAESQSQTMVWVVWIAWLLLFSHGFRRPVLTTHFVSVTSASVAIGFFLTIVGLAFSVCARFCIGKNWSAQIEVKEDHQLVRSGPYAIVRHPIYSGFMLATLGTAIAFGELSGLFAVSYTHLTLPTIYSV